MREMVAPGNPLARLEADGSFSLDRVYPGAYRIVPMNGAPGYFLDSIKLGETETSVSEVEISSGAASITLTYKTNGATVRVAAEKCASGEVVLVPLDPAMRRTGFLHSAPCNATDRYEIGPVRPGEYYVLALSGDGPEPVYATKLDDTLLWQADKVTLRAGETTSADLRAVISSQQ